MRIVGDYLRIVTLINDGLLSLEFSGASFEPGFANWPELKRCSMNMNPNIQIQVSELLPDGGITTLLITSLKSDTTASPADTPCEDKETGPGLERPSK